MRYAVVRTDGTYEFIETEGHLKLDELQRHVAAPDEDNAFVEAVGGPNLTIFLNENGKFLPLGTNEAVTEYAHEHDMIWSYDDIRGNCVITGIPDEEGYEQDVDQKVVEDIISHF